MHFVTLLRHGAHSDVGLRLTGRGDDGGLTAIGRMQVTGAIASLRDAPPSAIYTSPRRRTQETAKMVADRFGLPVEVAPALDEIDFGSWSGKSFAQLNADPAWTEWNEHRSQAAPPGGETQTAAQARALAFLFEVAATHEAPALLVTHCDIIRSLVCWAERRSLDDIHAISCEPGSLTHIDLLAQAEVA